ncbi:MAG: hypothetical protein H6Q67_781 [Firmicutes bacterium]|nr:hypothetical protein [Bacillota bacterium]
MFLAAHVVYMFLDRAGTIFFTGEDQQQNDDDDDNNNRITSSTTAKSTETHCKCLLSKWFFVVATVSYDAG